MILAGIDEAGLGPAMGPLCVCAAVLRLSDAALAADGCAADDCAALAAWPWERLAGLAGREGKDKLSPLLITDSKIAHKVRGVAGLEAAALSFWLAAQTDGAEAVAVAEQVWPAELSRERLLTSLGAQDVVPALKGCPWYAGGWPLPAHAPAGLILDCARQLRAEDGLSVPALRARVLTEKMLNDLFARDLNKSEVLLLQTGAHIRFVYEQYPDEAALIVVDKQGGRNFYAPFLSEMLGGAWVQTICEGADLSEYVVARPDGIERLHPGAVQE